MPATHVDLVIVLDTSASMSPCFDGLRRHLSNLANPIQNVAARIRYGLVTCSTGKSQGGSIFSIQGLNGTGVIDNLYGSNPNNQPDLFTESPSELTETLSRLKPRGDEDMLLALDCALDFPFGPLHTTRRVVALFSDEPLEGNSCFDQRKPKIPDLLKKITDRRIQLFMAIPLSESSEELASADRSELEQVDGGNGLAEVDFKNLLLQMGKSISAFSLQSATEPAHTTALFGQNQWQKGSGSFEGLA